MIVTEAWVLKKLNNGPAENGLVREEISFPDIKEDEILVAPLYGCWEGNMTHAIKRSPLDLCETRNEDRVVIGNAGVVRVEKVGSEIDDVAPGEVGILFCNGIPDDQGYPKLIFGYDAPGTIGMLAKKTKLKRHQFIAIPQYSKASLQQWAAFSLRYITAWANWRIALNTWRLQNERANFEECYVGAWGGGVSLAELELAKNDGFNAVMVSSMSERIQAMKKKGIIGVDRSTFSKDRYDQDFLDKLSDVTQGKGISIFIDNIGCNFQTTLKSLSRRAVIATTGWKANMIFPLVRSAECINRHIHVFTHYAKYNEGIDAIKYAVKNDWLPSLTEKSYGWEDIPQLVDDYESDRTKDYFPIFSVNEIDARAITLKEVA